jgi:hypothetical protein
MRRSIAEFVFVLEQPEPAHGHLAAGGRAVVVEQVGKRDQEGAQILLRKPGLRGRCRKVSLREKRSARPIVLISNCGALPA